MGSRATAARKPEGPGRFAEPGRELRLELVLPDAHGAFEPRRRPHPVTDLPGNGLRVVAAATGRNLAASRTARLGLGPTRDVVMIEGEVEVFGLDALPRERVDLFVERADFDPRPLAAPYCWFRVTPRRIQAWREENELNGRELMRDGHWLA